MFREEGTSGYPCKGFEDFVLGELRNEAKSLFLIDSVGHQTRTESKMIDLKIMNLFQDSERLVVATGDQDIVYQRDEIPFLDIMAHMESTKVFELDRPS